MLKTYHDKIVKITHYDQWLLDQQLGFGLDYFNLIEWNQEFVFFKFIIHLLVVK